MQIFHASEVSPDGRGLVCRQSRLQGVISALVIGGILTAVPLFTWYHEVHWLVWTLSGSFAVLIVPMVVSDAAARFRPSNWLLWLDADGLWLNLRSYQTVTAADLPTVARLRYDEIASASKHVETYILPGQRKNRTVRHREQSLDLRLKRPDGGVLRAALVQERHHPGKGKTYAGGITVTTRAALFPISVPADDAARILWRGGQGHFASPSLTKVLRELETQGVAIGEPTSFDRPRYDTLAEPEFDDLVRHLAGSTGGLSAVTLLRDRRGLSTTEARTIVDGIVAGRPLPVGREQ